MKFLLVKALLGFGDRLEYLAMCVDFCKKNNVKLRVDWTDPVWGEEFTKYFSLNLPSFEFDEVSSVSVYPPIWKGRLAEPLLKFPELKDFDIRTLTNLPEEELVVVTSHGFRTFFRSHKFFGELFHVIDPRIIAAVRERQEKYNLKDKWCVHLRGTDRFKKSGSKERRFQEFKRKQLGAK
jgi:hypothetical protein